MQSALFFNKPPQLYFSSMDNLCGWSYPKLTQWLLEKGEPSYRASQIFDWIYVKKVASFDEMVNLSKNLRAHLQEHFRFFSLTKISEAHSKETTKYLWRLSDARRVESVLIRSFQRRTVCLSSQVGCAARCAFCASGKEGLIRSLSSGEIVEQAYQIDKELSEVGERVSHLVYMGMGEPLDNYESVIESIRILNSEQALNISQRRITVSTVGVIPGIRKLAEEDLSVNLVLSLHAPNQQLRKKIIPTARKYPLDEILDAMEEYANKSGRDVTYEYTLMAGLNDQPEHAEELAVLLKAKQCTVNLIPYNPVMGLKLKRPEHEAIVQFRSILEKRGLRVTWRYTKGDDIAAACGQLALQK